MSRNPFEKSRLPYETEKDMGNQHGEPHRRNVPGQKFTSDEDIVGGRRAEKPAQEGPRRERGSDTLPKFTSDEDILKRRSA
jgi:hypothetical protein